MKEDTFTKLAECPQKCIKSRHHGSDHQLDLIFKETILNFIFENHEQGVLISVITVVAHVCSLPQEFKMKASNVKQMAIARFLKNGDICTSWIYTNPSTIFVRLRMMQESGWQW